MLINYRILLTFVFFVSATMLCAQDLVNFNQERLDMTKNGMLVLGSWATLNILSSPFLANNTSGSTRYFHQMNGYWNIVNLAIAGFGYYGAATGDASVFSLTETITEQQKIEKVLLFNAGLDLGYIAGGLYLTERSKRGGKNADRLKGFGRSIMLQGAFLFTFDLIFYFVQSNHGSELFQLIDNLALSPTGFRFSMKI